MNHPSGILLIAFGGPEKFEDVRPFLANVLRGRPVPAERIEAVVEHYRDIGGFSPLNEATVRQAQALESLFEKKKISRKVYVGMRNWKPSIPDALEEMKRDGVERARAIVLAPHRCEASWERYRESVLAAQEKMGNVRPDIVYAEPWHTHPLFIAAVCARLREVISSARDFSGNDIGSDRAYWIFTAHSIPLSMDKESGYSQQIFETARLVAQKRGQKKWSVAYQSRSGRPQEKWLEPDINEKIKELAAAGIKSALLIPIGFVCDHVEVLYDLDIEAKKSCAERGVKFLRVKTVSDHPLFIQMLAQLAAVKINQETH